MRFAEYPEIRIGMCRNVPRAFLARGGFTRASVTTLSGSCHFALPRFRKIRRISREMRATPAARNLQANCQFSDDPWTRTGQAVRTSMTHIRCMTTCDLMAEPVCGMHAIFRDSSARPGRKIVYTPFPQTWISGLAKRAVCVQQSPSRGLIR